MKIVSLRRTYLKIARGVPFALQFMRVTSGSVLERVNRTKRFTILYTELQWEHYQTTAKNLHPPAPSINWPLRWKAVIQRLKTWRDRLFSMHEATQYGEKVQWAAKKGLGFLSLYYESLQSLVEGRRQVMQDEDFTFQDGMTVKQKQEQFEKRLRTILGPKKSQDDSRNPAQKDNDIQD